MSIEQNRNNLNFIIQNYVQNMEIMNKIPTGSIAVQDYNMQTLKETKLFT